MKPESSPLMSYEKKNKKTIYVSIYIIFCVPMLKLDYIDQGPSLDWDLRILKLYCNANCKLLNNVVF